MSYSPNLGRWKEQDPTGYVDGLNLYERERSAPIRFLDPLGLQAATVDFAARHAASTQPSPILSSGTPRPPSTQPTNPRPPATQPTQPPSRDDLDRAFPPFKDYEYPPSNPYPPGTPPRPQLPTLDECSDFYHRFSFTTAWRDRKNGRLSITDPERLKILDYFGPIYDQERADAINAIKEFIEQYGPIPIIPSGDLKADKTVLGPGKG